MFRNIVMSIGCLIILLGAAGCGERGSRETSRESELMIYCGITMVKPIREIADTFEQEFDCKVIMSQGGSEDLYQSLKLSRQGDLYLPGSESYRKKHLNEGLLSDCVYLGFNQASLMVQKGNPRNITGDLKWLLDDELAVVIGNPEMCSIGKQTQKILAKAEIFDRVVDNSYALAADSRDLNKHLKTKTADLMVNWRATAFFSDNRDAIDVVELSPTISPRKELLLNLLTFSEQQDLARSFMEYASSPAGRMIFRKYGFLDDDGPAGDLIRSGM